MEEKEKWTVPTENVEEKPKKLEEKEEKSEREKIADYVISRLPDEIQSQINSGKTLAGELQFKKRKSEFESKT